MHCICGRGAAGDCSGRETQRPGDMPVGDVAVAGRIAGRGRDGPRLSVRAAPHRSQRAEPVVSHRSLTFFRNPIPSRTRVGGGRDDRQRIVDGQKRWRRRAAPIGRWPIARWRRSAAGASTRRFGPRSTAARYWSMSLRSPWARSTRASAARPAVEATRLRPSGLWCSPGPSGDERHTRRRGHS